MPKTVDRTYNSPINKNDLVSFQKDAKKIILNPNEFPIEGQRYETYADIVAYLFSLPPAEQPSITNLYVVEFNGIITENITLAPYVHLKGCSYFSSKLTGTLTSNSPTSLDYFQYSVNNCTIDYLDMTLNPMELLVVNNCYILNANTDGALAIIVLGGFIQGGEFNNVDQVALFNDCTFFPTGGEIAKVERTSELSRVYFSDPTTIKVGQFIYFDVDLDATFNGVYEVLAVDPSGMYAEYAQPGEGDVSLLAVSGNCISVLSVNGESKVQFNNCNSLAGDPALNYPNLIGKLQFVGCNMQFSNIIQSTSNHQVTFLKSMIGCSLPISFILDAGIEHNVIDSGLGVSDISTSTISYIINGGTLNTANLLTMNNIVDYSGGWINKGSRFNNSIGIPGSPDCMQTAIESLYSATGSPQNLLISNQSVDGSVPNFNGVDYNVSSNQWERTDNACQVRGIFVSTLGALTNCVVFKGVIPSLGLPEGSYWFDFLGSISTTESDVHAGVSLPSGDFIVDISVEKGRIGPLKTTLAPSILTAYEAISGDKTDTVQSMVMTADIINPTGMHEILTFHTSYDEYPGERATIITLYEPSNLTYTKRLKIRNSGGATLSLTVSACKWDDTNRLMWVVGQTDETGINTECFIGVIDSSPGGEYIEYILFSDGHNTYIPNALDLKFDTLVTAFVCGTVGDDSFLASFEYDPSQLPGDRLAIVTSPVVHKTETGGVPAGTRLVYRDIAYDSFYDYIAVVGAYEVGAGQSRPFFMAIQTDLFTGQQPYVMVSDNGATATGLAIKESTDPGLLSDCFILGMTGGANPDVFIQHMKTNGGSLSVGNVEYTSAFAATSPSTGKLKYEIGKDLLFGTINATNLGTGERVTLLTRTLVSDLLSSFSSTSFQLVSTSANESVELDLACVAGESKYVAYVGSTRRGGFSNSQGMILNVLEQGNDVEAIDADNITRISDRYVGLFAIDNGYSNEPGWFIAWSSAPGVSEIPGTYSITDPTDYFDEIAGSVPFYTAGYTANIFDAGTYWVEKSADPTALNDIYDSAGLGVFFRRGYIWLNQLTRQFFLCTEDRSGDAKWLNITPKNTMNVTDYFINSLNKEWRIKTNTDPVNNIIEFNKTVGVSGFAYNALRLGVYESQRIELDWDEATVVDVSRHTYMRLDMAYEANAPIPTMLSMIFEWGLVSAAGSSSGAYILLKVDEATYGSLNLHLCVSDGINPESATDLGITLEELKAPVLELAIVDGSTITSIINGSPKSDSTVLSALPMQPWLALESVWADGSTKTFEFKRHTIENER